MAENLKKYCKNTTIAAFLICLLFAFGSVALATVVDRMAIPNLEGYPGKTIQQEIKLEGTDLEERTGFWYAHYKKTEGDDARMDITSWITIEPKDYTIKPGETKVFIVAVKIPKDAKPGLYGASSEEAWQEGHSGERRTYIVFKDALGGGNVYSGLLLPISVRVLPSQNPLAPVVIFAQQNILVIVLSIVIIVLLAAILFKKRKQASKEKSASRA